MSVIVRGKNIEVTEALRNYAEKKVGIITKQIKVVGDIAVMLRVEKGQHIVELTVPAKCITFRAQERTGEMYSSLDLVVEKISRQIHKFKTRLVRNKYVEYGAENAYPDEPAEDNDFAVVRNKKYTLRPMDVQEAILQMNMLNHDFFLFFDAETEKISLVYKRKDGDYGLIVPEMK